MAGSGGWVGCLGSCVRQKVGDVSRYSIVFACMLAAGCAASPVGELGQRQCTDGEDNDHDGRTNCDDPDCQNTVCLVPIVDHAMDAAVGSGGAMSHPPPVTDAARPPLPDAAMSQEDEDGGMTRPPIIDMDASIGCTHACAATEECVDAGCVPVAVSMSVQFKVTITSVVAADTTPLANCYEADCPNPFAFAPCAGCHIDPYVRVVRIRPDESEEEVGKTNAVSDNTSPTFDRTPMTVALSQGDALGFEVWDANREVPDLLLFSCKPDLTDPQPGPLDCSPAESNLVRPLQVRAKLEAL